MSVGHSSLHMAQSQHEKEALALYDALYGLLQYYFGWGTGKVAQIHCDRIESVFEPGGAATKLGPLNLIPKPDDGLWETDFRLMYWREVLRPILVTTKWPKVKGDGSTHFKGDDEMRVRRIKTLNAAVVYWDKVYPPSKLY